MTSQHATTISSPSVSNTSSRIGVIGIPCPQCGSTKRDVTESRPRIGYIYRRIVCLSCDHRYTTKEVLADQINARSIKVLTEVTARLRSLGALLEDQITTMQREV